MDKIEELQKELQKVKTFILSNTNFKVVNLSVKNVLSDDKELRLVLEEKEK